MNEDSKNNFESVVKKGKDIAEDGLEKVKEVAINVKEKVVKTLDVDNDGDVDFDDFKLMAKKGGGLLKNITKKDKE